MKPFLDDHFLLQGRTAQTLFHEYAASMPIFDYHCHLPPEQIAEDYQWDNLGEIWLAGDHYKWRAMRTNGVEERLITGASSWKEKFDAWVATVPHTMRNPLYHWSHLELKRYFGIETLLSPATADEIYETATAQLRTSAFSARNLMRNMKVKVVCTTDDPADDLRHHLQIREEGVEVVHLSGLIAALSSKTSAFCLEVARVAQENGSKVSFDLNYRASFWKGREEELSATFAEIASRADILMGNEEDFQLCLGMEGPEEGGTGLEEKIEAFKEMIERVQVAYPNASWFGTTLREVQSANRHLWGALVSHAGAWEIIKPREIGVLDRIGGGDGFVGGLLYGILKGWSVDKCTQFGWASGALAATMLTDYVQPVDEEQLWNIWEGNARVKR